jgi:hypothetical protein
MPKKSEPDRWRTEGEQYATHTRKGLPHGNTSVRGCVIRTPIGKEGRRTLWLEYARAKGGRKRPDDEQFFWLVWYDAAGRPLTPGSAVFRKADLQNLLSSLLEYVPR